MIVFYLLFVCQLMQGIPGRNSTKGERGERGLRVSFLFTDILNPILPMEGDNRLTTHGYTYITVLTNMKVELFFKASNNCIVHSICNDGTF